ncbi:MAG: DUF4159 domain-containing protein [Gemmatimonadetes bacterium]|nr:DUF4159 domain-containing protein [Gemmatimonadota bacterium]
MRPFSTVLTAAAVAVFGVILASSSPEISGDGERAREESEAAISAAGVDRSPPPRYSFFASPAGLRLPSAPLPTEALGPVRAWNPQEPQEPGGARNSQDPDGVSPLPEVREFFFTRAAYTGYRGRGGWGRRPSWAIDYPEADHHFMTVLKRLTNLDGYDWDNAIRLEDPELRRFPFLYALEVGYMDLTEPEVRGLRDYLDAGGFLVIDDFWGMREWDNFVYNMSRVLPGREIEDLSLDHPLFNVFYDITEVRQTPAIGRGVNGRPTWESPDSKVPMVKGIHDDDGRLMVVINWNTDLGDAWEHAENPFYPLEYSTYAYQVGVNMVVYGMSH